ncbi:recombinase family protein [Ferrimicrobium sp.]|uniref:recombinase family protein n=1 Tax=Ferrimicrobium sp. TaxID=2926050 RepID=UPI002626ECA6|nr:recombinase family protein [Ferrimicrobium sp.]
MEAFGLYVRGSSYDQREDLHRQVFRLAAWAADVGGQVVDVAAEVGSGMKSSHTKIRRMLADPKITGVMVEHRDRLGRMRVELIEAVRSAHGRRLVVLDDGEVDDDLVRCRSSLRSACAVQRGTVRQRPSTTHSTTSDPPVLAAEVASHEQKPEYVSWTARLFLQQRRVRPHHRLWWPEWDLPTMASAAHATMTARSGAHG